MLRSHRSSRSPSALWLAVALLAPGPLVLAQDQEAADTATPSACASLDPDRSFDFQGRTLRDAPGLATPQARRLHAELARGECADEAAGRVAELAMAHPQDREIAFLEARVDALAGRRAVAERRLDALLQETPDLQPAQALKAALLLDREKRAEARQWLARAAAARPDDLRTAFHQMRVDALDAPKGDGVRKLFQVLRDRQLPPDLREQAQQTLLYITALDLGQKEAALREGLTFASQTPRWDKANALARLLAEESGKLAQARTIAQGVVDDPAASLEAKHQAGILVAETWLMEAAKIDPAPSPRNAALVAKAKAAVGDDLVPLAGRIRSFHDLAPLRPFVAEVHDADERGADGLTALCRGAQLLDGSRVRRALEAGAKVDGECSGSTALAYVVRQGPGLFEMKKDILEALLAAGADPDPKLYPGSTYTAMSFCAEALPGCSEQLLPILQQYAKPAPAQSVTQ